MEIEIVDTTLDQESAKRLAEHAEVSCRFEISSILELSGTDGGLGGFAFNEVPQSPAQWKDYDALESPIAWAAMWDLSRWGMISAYAERNRIGGCVVAFDTDGVHMLEGRSDITALWDIRVAPAFRGQGMGAQLFRSAVDWSRARGCRAMKIETQNNNVPACRFYAAQGCVLRTIDRFAYRQCPEEVQLIWQKDIGTP